MTTKQLTTTPLEKIAGFVPEGGWNMNRDDEMFEAGDEQAPLATEAATYNLCFKDSARTLLRLFREAKAEDAALRKLEEAARKPYISDVRILEALHDLDATRREKRQMR